MPWPITTCNWPGLMCLIWNLIDIHCRRLGTNLNIYVLSHNDMLQNTFLENRMNIDHRFPLSTNVINVSVTRSHFGRNRVVFFCCWTSLSWTEFVVSGVWNVVSIKTVAMDHVVNELYSMGFSVFGRNPTSGARTNKIRRA